MKYTSAEQGVRLYPLINWKKEKKNLIAETI